MVTYGYILVTGWLHEVQFVDEFAGDLRGQAFAVVSILSLLELSLALGRIEQVLFATEAAREKAGEAVEQPVRVTRIFLETFAEGFRAEVNECL